MLVSQNFTVRRQRGKLDGDGDFILKGMGFITLQGEAVAGEGIEVGDRLVDDKGGCLAAETTTVSPLRKWKA